MPDLALTLDLRQSHHLSNRPVVNRGTPTGASYQSPWSHLAEIREQADASDAACVERLVAHHNLITAVEARHRVTCQEALTYRGPSRRN